ncbi:MAG: adenosine deaminase family protein [Terriglobales bacterium]
MGLSRRGTVLASFLLASCLGIAQSPPMKPGHRLRPPNASAPTELRAARYLDSIRNQPSLLLEFVRQFPKGADLHNHLTGAVYAETFINFAAHDNLCVDRKSLRLLPPVNKPEPPPAEPKVLCDESKGHVPAARAFSDYLLYRDLIDAWSMRHFTPGVESGHDHFFDTFSKFSLAKGDNMGAMLAEAVSRAGHEHVRYLELMLGPDGGAALRLGAISWNGDMAAQRQKLIEQHIETAVAAARLTLDRAEAKMRDELHCGSLNADAGCGVTVRFIYEVHRGFARDQVFAEMLAGMEMATADPRVVGINLVMPEDAYVPMHDFSLHMQMLDFLHKLYPEVHIALHAGELAMSLVPPEALKFHVRESLEVGHAERIGHAASVMYERDAISLLQQMARRHVAVEVCLTSNDMILGVRDADHPLLMFLKYGVPVSLATDDEGVARSDLNHEYLRAIESYKLPYSTLKRISRNGLEYAFLPGASLWADAGQFHRASCRDDQPLAAEDALSTSCRQFLKSSERARLQWKLEGEFTAFERQVGSQH